MVITQTVVPAVVGLAIGWLGGLPAALAHIGVLEVPPAAVSEQGALRLIADGTGLAGGLGYVALFGLIAHRMPGWARRHPAVVAVAAVRVVAAEFEANRAQRRAVARLVHAKKSSSVRRRCKVALTAASAARRAVSVSAQNRRDEFEITAGGGNLVGGNAEDQCEDLEV